MAKTEMAEMKLRMSKSFIDELVTGLVGWMDIQRMLGDYVVHFFDGTKAYGNIPDPSGPRWVHVFIQSEDNHRIFEYREALVRYDVPVIMIKVEEKDAPTVETVDVIVDEAKDIFDVPPKEVVASGDNVRDAKEEAMDAFFDGLKYEQCLSCGEHHFDEKRHEEN